MRFNIDHYGHKNRKLIAGCIMAGLLIILPLLYFSGKYFFVVQHQRSVIIELREWQNQYLSIDSQSDAFQAIDMYKYISSYYVVGEGYYANQKIAQELESQRVITLETIVRSLEGFTGHKYGDNYAEWKKWQESQ